MMKILLSMIALVSSAQASEDILNPAYNALKASKSDLSESDKVAVANAVMDCAKANSIRWSDILGIAKVESSFRSKIVRKVKGRWVDHGLFQINILSIKHHNLDKKRILDPLYNTQAACKIITDIKRLRKNWIGYYNVGPHSKRDEQRLAYEKKVKKQSSLLKNFEFNLLAQGAAYGL